MSHGEPDAVDRGSVTPPLPWAHLHLGRPAQKLPISASAAQAGDMLER